MNNIIFDGRGLTHREAEKACREAGHRLFVSDVVSPHGQTTYKIRGSRSQCIVAYEMSQEKAKSKQYAAYHSSDETRLLQIYKSRRSYATKNGIPFTISFEEIWEAFSGGVCQVTGVPFRTDKARGLATPSLDKTIPELGYVPGNVKLVVWAFNSLKGDSSEEEAIALIKEMSKGLGS